MIPERTRRDARRRAGDQPAPALTGALSPLLPGREDTWLLRTLLHRGTPAREAWQAFCARVPHVPSAFRLDTGGRKRLSPLLLVALRENAIEADAPLLTVLRTAYLREELRSRAYRQIVAPVLAALRDGGLRFLVLKGAALAETVYADPVLRHAHDVDVLVAPADADKAGTIVQGTGLAAVRALPEAQGRQFRHQTGLPFLLLERLYRLSYYPSDLDTVWARAGGARVAGIEVRVPSRADQLLHALGHASYCPSRTTLLWVTDAWMLLAGPDGVDWAVFLAAVEESRLELPVHTMLTYLSRELDAAVPATVLDELGRRAARARGARRDVALLGARQTRPEPARLPDAVPGDWRTGLEHLRSRILPSSEYMAWRYGSSTPARLLLLYLMRTLDYVRRRFVGSLHRRRVRGRSLQNVYARVPALISHPRHDHGEGGRHQFERGHGRDAPDPPPAPGMGSGGGSRR